MTTIADDPKVRALIDATLDAAYETAASICEDHASTPGRELGDIIRSRRRFQKRLSQDSQRA